MTSVAELAAIAARIRARVVEMSHEAETPHLGSSLSCVDLLVATYWGPLRIDPAHPLDPNRDRFILSKGHAATALYVTLAEKGFFDPALLDTYDTDGGALPEHPGLQCVPGVEAATGSLGHGLPIALGMALAARIQKRPARQFVLMSDGECEEGSVWEAALCAGKHKLSNLTAIVDYNKLQSYDRTSIVQDLEPLTDKWRSFGFAVHEVDGHDVAALQALMKTLPFDGSKPSCIISHTVKGKGIAVAEGNPEWHHKSKISAKELADLYAELEG